MLTSIVLCAVVGAIGAIIFKIRALKRILDIVESNAMDAIKDEAMTRHLEIGILKEAIQKINTHEPKKKGGNPYPRSDEHKRKLSEAAKRRQEIRRTTIALPHIQPTGTSSDLS